MEFDRASHRFGAQRLGLREYLSLGEGMVFILFGTEIKPISGLFDVSHFLVRGRVNGESHGQGSGKSKQAGA